jgi:hypothetical protein
MATLCTRNDVKTALGIADTVDDARIDVALESSSEMIQDYCSRQFLVDSTSSARLFVAQDPWLVHLDDISTTAGLIVETDESGTGTFGTTWAATDYQLEPLNGKVNGMTRPYNTLRAIQSKLLPVDGGRATVRVTALWGWPSVPDAVKQAAIIQTISIFRAVDAPFGATPFAETGIIRLRTALHPTAAALLSDYRLDAVRVA